MPYIIGGSFFLTGGEIISLLLGKFFPLYRGRFFLTPGEEIASHLIAYRIIECLVFGMLRIGANNQPLGDQILQSSTDCPFGIPCIIRKRLFTFKQDLPLPAIGDDQPKDEQLASFQTESSAQHPSIDDEVRHSYFLVA